jgi:hypothetical protein
MGIGQSGVARNRPGLGVEDRRLSCALAPPVPVGGSAAGAVRPVAVAVGGNGLHLPQRTGRAFPVPASIVAGGGADDVVALARLAVSAGDPPGHMIAGGLFISHRLRARRRIVHLPRLAPRRIMPEPRQQGSRLLRHSSLKCLPVRHISNILTNLRTALATPFANSFDNIRWIKRSKPSMGADIEICSQQ